MIGIYKVYEDGKLIREVKNKLTLLGRSNALSTMLGLTQSFAGSMGIGISSAANTPLSGSFLDKTDLDFGVGKYPITASSLGLNGSKDVLVYTARITDPSRYDIYELGLYSNQLNGSVDVDSLTLFNFESGDSLKEGTHYLDETYSPRNAIVLDNVINYRIGSNAVKLLKDGLITYSDSPIDLSSFYEYDSLKLAFYSSGDPTVTIKFYSGENNYATYSSFNGAANSYNIISALKKSGTTNGNVDWSNITQIDISVSGSNGEFVILDGLRVSKDKPIDSIDGLVSRAVLDTKIEKLAGSIIDIEYSLIFDMDAG